MECSDIGRQSAPMALIGRVGYTKSGAVDAVTRGSHMAAAI